MSESIYILGHSPAEIRRLINQATILRPTTERLLRSAGIEQGMRVLDVGCGAGDVSMLAGRLVGASGSVVGIDLNADILAVARERSQVDGFMNVTFAEASVGTFADPMPFDLVIARYVLIHQVDPVAFLRAAARFVKPGGVLALHEPILDRVIYSRPNVALWQQTADWILATFQARTPSWDAAGRMVECWTRAARAVLRGAGRRRRRCPALCLVRGCGSHPPAADDPGRGRDRGDDCNRNPRKSAQVCCGRNP
jgi:2-polyprenyl-3-methyl-5-hydroxy-6-metoxy-1,4-benzoquinol methylase